MGKQKVLLPKSSVSGKSPAASAMTFGELYINYAAGSGTSFLVTKKADSTLAKFSEDIPGEVYFGDYEGESAIVDPGTGEPVDLNDYALKSWVEDKGYLTDYIESDPTVPSWAKASSKPTYSASEVGALPSTTKYASGISLTMDSNTFVITAQLKDQNGNNIGAQQTVDLPLESVVVSGTYLSSTKEVQLTLKNGNNIKFSVEDLVSGLQNTLSSTNKLNADYIQDGSTNKVYTSTEKTKLSGIASGAEVNVQSDWSVTATTNDAYIKNKPTIGNGVLTIQKNGTTINSFSANQTGVVTVNVTVPTNVNELTNGSGYITTANTKDFITSAVTSLKSFATSANVVTSLSNKVDKVSGKGLSTNDFTTALQTKLNGIASGAEVNQKAFSVIKVNTNAVSADTTTDTFTISAGTNVTLSSTDGTTNKLVISATDTKPGNAYRVIQINTSGQNCSATTSADTFIISAGTNVTLTRGTKKLTISAIDTKPGTLTTTATTSLSTATNESLSGTVSLHKIAKTGSYSDLNNKPIPNISSSDNGKILQVVNGSLSLVMPVSIYSGTTTPSNTLGSNGDIYLQL